MQNEPQLSAEQLQLVTEWWDKNYLDFGIGNNSTKLGLIIGLLATALEEQATRHTMLMAGLEAQIEQKAVIRASELVDKARADEREKVLSEMKGIISKYQIAKEVVIDGQRFLIVDGEKKEFGYPYPDTKEKYAIYDLLAKLNQLKGIDVTI